MQRQPVDADVVQYEVIRQLGLHVPLPEIGGREMLQIAGDDDLGASLDRRCQHMPVGWIWEPQGGSSTCYTNDSRADRQGELSGLPRLRRLRWLGVLGLPVPPKEFGQCGNLGRRRRPALAGNAYRDPLAASGIAFLYLDHACLLQHGQVPGQVAGSQAECLAQVAELGALRLGGDREDAEPSGR